MDEFQGVTSNAAAVERKWDKRELSGPARRLMRAYMAYERSAAARFAGRHPLLLYISVMGPTVNSAREASDSAIRCHLELGLVFPEFRPCGVVPVRGWVSQTGQNETHGWLENCMPKSPLDEPLR